jgi:hypothetical protein
VDWAGWVNKPQSGERIMTVFGMSASAAAASHITPGNNTYEVVAAAPGISWADARAAAAATTNGGPLCAGHLATVTSAAENALLVSTFGAGLNEKWLDGYQVAGSAEPAGGWTWVTGEPWSYTNWGGSEPNNSGGIENAVLFFFNNGTWNDVPENYLYGAGAGYVVEYECRQIAIDVQPGGSPNSINNNGHGVIPVAILTTDTFDAATVDPSTVTLDGAAVRVKGKSGTAGSLEDVDGDGDLDLVVQIRDADGTYLAGTTTAILKARTFAGEDVTASDTIRLVP